QPLPTRLSALFISLNDPSNPENYTLSLHDALPISVGDEVEGVEEEHLGISFKNFGLSSVTSLLNPDTLIADGLLNGRLIVEDLFGTTGLIANVRIDQIGSTSSRYRLVTSCIRYVST